MIALGKLGGQELNYSSDIDLMFVYSAQRRDRRARRHQQQGILQEGRQPVHRAAFHLHRRRPVLPRGSAPAARRPPGRGLHFRSTARKRITRARARLGKADAHQGAGLRRATPDRARALLEFVEPLIYQTTLDFRAVEAVSETRQRISEKAGRRSARSAGWISS